MPEIPSDVINVSSVTSWISEHADFEGPLTYELIAGGRSNMTFSGRRWASAICSASTAHGAAAALRS